MPCAPEEGRAPGRAVPRLADLRLAGPAWVGALDFLVTPEGEWVFLEVNPNGQWAFVEQATGLPIAAAIADALCSEGSPR
jgi:biotin carboxylase